MTVQTESWQEIAQKKREAVFAKIPKEWIIEVPSIEKVSNTRDYLDTILPKEEVAITDQSLLQLSEKIQKGELTSLEITTAFCHRAALTHQIINSCSEIFFERAFQRAKELDEIFKTTGKTIGPLHGIPISLKDQVNLEGLDSGIGLISKLNKPKTKDDESIIAKILYDAGAVFYVKTTTPMAMMAPDTNSNIYGQTVNALNRLLSAGGSSGGESSLIGAKGGLIGLSTDIGGSIRIPAAFQGLFALRPCSGRLPYAKVTNSMAFQPIVPSVIGPSARYLDDLKFFVKTIIDAKPWLYDPKTPPIPWREYEVPEKLTFGIIKNNGMITPHPPVARAMELIKSKLESLGHEVVEWEHPIPNSEMVKNLNQIFTADGYKEIKEACDESGEPIIKQLMERRAAGRELSVSEHWAQAQKKYESQLIYDKYWLDTASKTSTGRPIDAWISPLWESTSYPAGETKSYHCSYTYPVNYMDLSSMVVPITSVDKSIDKPYDNFTPISENDSLAQGVYDADLFDGMPVCVQVVTPRYEEERAISLAGVVYDATH
ncbi:hypothetical protein WICANDRAFT_63720 [Wickerhamomyces anomalus NRRL Y-366-8]|uniref:Amidase domain-containing protein n=1 Tax=Wickerhamomyces anomalus (strain ATCC 58044 / CBS 1984 / NCYC 433 / NRRL Y-366-8) TaxID=683960 RepID=A0A1E3P163_WICAA|nr:uncharacterized protein WICANDRAFT_63720 [Wickerhamomyces anomalus NRRL Y-366-8]ODQ59226.1 hypothetical protein WICANDRAFT_63720 [Wickerhamomyces anomalus NRRL Y-366-8]